MTKLFFTADTHFGHGNIIDYGNRPFRFKKTGILDVKKMNETLLRNWNSRVKDGDDVIFLGDFCFKNTKGGKEGEGLINKPDFYRKKLNGNIVFVRGNHDNNNSLNTKISSLVVEIGGYEFWCCHDPRDYSPAYRINLVGHVHAHWKTKRMDDGTWLINVGVDVWNYHPVEISQILKLINKTMTVRK